MIPDGRDHPTPAQSSPSPTTTVTPSAAERTQPFLANENRLSELFPMEQRESVDLLVDLLVQPLTDATPVDGPPDAPPDAPRRDAEAIYRLVFGLLHAHLIQRTRPTAETIGHTVRFCMLGAGLDVARSSR